MPPTPPCLRITAVRVHKLHAPITNPFGWSLNWTSHRAATLVEVRTDAGLTGWGDGAAAEEMLLARPELVIGRSPFEAEAIYEELRRPAGHQERRGPSRCGGLDTALWDLMGQALGMPVSRLLGQQHRTKVRPYCTALYRTACSDLAEALAAEAVLWKERGFRSMKMKIGYGPELDASLVQAVRSAVGSGVGLAVDSNCAYDPGTAVRLGRRLEEFDLMWWEEPLLADDLEGYRRLRESIRIPIAGGETLLLDSLIHDYVQRRTVDVLQPEVELIGLTGARHLNTLCWLHRIRLAPHNWGTAVRTAAILHWVATVPPLTPALLDDATFELDQTENPLREAVIEPAFSMDPEGYIAVPDAPGLGVRVIPEAVAEHRAELIEIG